MSDCVNADDSAIRTMQIGASAGKLLNWTNKFCKFLWFYYRVSIIHAQLIWRAFISPKNHQFPSPGPLATPLHSPQGFSSGKSAAENLLLFNCSYCTLFIVLLDFDIIICLVGKFIICLKCEQELSNLEEHGMNAKINGMENSKEKKILRHFPVPSVPSVHRVTIISRQ